MIDLFSIALQSATEWGIGKALDVIFSCDRCAEPKSEKIANVQHNDLLCGNCGKHVRQFTNACNFTVASSGLIAQVGATLSPDLKWTFKNGRADEAHWSGHFRFQNLQGKQVLERSFVRDFDTDQILSHEEAYTWRPTTMDETMETHITGRFGCIPDALLQNRTQVLEVVLLSRFRDVLFHERELI